MKIFQQRVTDFLFYHPLFEVSLPWVTLTSFPLSFQSVLWCLVVPFCPYQWGSLECLADPFSRSTSICVRDAIGPVIPGWGLSLALRPKWHYYLCSALLLTRLWHLWHTLDAAAAYCSVLYSVPSSLSINTLLGMFYFSFGSPFTSIFFIIHTFD